MPGKELGLQSKRDVWIQGVFCYPFKSPSPHQLRSWSRYNASGVLAAGPGRSRYSRRVSVMHNLRLILDHHRLPKYDVCFCISFPFAPHGSFCLEGRPLPNELFPIPTEASLPQGDFCVPRHSGELLYTPVRPSTLTDRCCFNIRALNSFWEHRTWSLSSLPPSHGASRVRGAQSPREALAPGPQRDLPLPRPPPRAPCTYGIAFRTLQFEVAVERVRGRALALHLLADVEGAAPGAIFPAVDDVAPTSLSTTEEQSGRPRGTVTLTIIRPSK